MRADPERPHGDLSGSRSVGQQQVAGGGAVLLTVLQVLSKAPLMTPPKAKTMTTISAAMPATSRPYSTAEAPSSSRGGW